MEAVARRGAARLRRGHASPAASRTSTRTARRPTTASSRRAAAAASSRSGPRSRRRRPRRCSRLGGTITHHHAVGRDHRPWYDRERPELFARALRAAKRALDPRGILNPGRAHRPVALDAASGDEEGRTRMRAAYSPRRRERRRGRTSRMRAACSRSTPRAATRKDVPGCGRRVPLVWGMQRGRAVIQTAHQASESLGTQWQGVGADRPRDCARPVGASRLWTPRPTTG